MSASRRIAADQPHDASTGNRPIATARTLKFDSAKPTIADASDASAFSDGMRKCPFACTRGEFAQGGDAPSIREARLNGPGGLMCRKRAERCGLFTASEPGRRSLPIFVRCMSPSMVSTRPEIALAASDARNNASDALLSIERAAPSLIRWPSSPFRPRLILHYPMPGSRVWRRRGAAASCCVTAAGVRIRAHPLSHPFAS